MGLERNLSAVPPVLFTATGTQYGVVTVTSTANFYVKSIACIQAASVNGGNPTKVEIKRIVSDTVMWVGPPGTITLRTDLTAYTVGAGSIMYAEEQPKAKIDMETRLLASYIQEPINGWRVQPVDSKGNPISADNPLPVVFDGTISIGAVEVHGQNGNTIEPNVDGSINVNIVNAQTSNIVHNEYGTASSVPGGVETSIVQYVVPGTLTSAVLQRISVSGENVGRYQVFVNGIVIDTRRTYYGANFSEYFEFAVGTADGYGLVPGDIVAVKILHSRPYIGNFEGRIQVFEIA